MHLPHEVPGKHMCHGPIHVPCLEQCNVPLYTLRGRRFWSHMVPFWDHVCCEVPSVHISHPTHVLARTHVVIQFAFFDLH